MGVLDVESEVVIFEIWVAVEGEVAHPEDFVERADYADVEGLELGVVEKVDGGSHAREDVQDTYCYEGVVLVPVHVVTAVL